MDNDPDSNLVELVKTLQRIDIDTEGAKENEFVIYDQDGNKIYL